MESSLAAVIKPSLKGELEQCIWKMFAHDSSQGGNKQLITRCEFCVQPEAKHFPARSGSYLFIWIPISHDQVSSYLLTCCWCAPPLIRSFHLVCTSHCVKHSQLHLKAVIEEHMNPDEPLPSPEQHASSLSPLWEETSAFGHLNIQL